MTAGSLVQRPYPFGFVRREYCVTPPKTVADRVKFLLDSHDLHLEVAGKMMEADNRALYGVDLIVFAAIHRSLALIKGYTLMVETRNVLCANALSRLQVDSLMRLYACWLVEDPESLVSPLIEGKPLARLKSRDGKPLTDFYLKTQVSKLYPWVTRVYDRTSGFIHLSAPHVFAFIADIDKVSGTLNMSIGDGGRVWSEEDVAESIDAFTEATKSLIHLASSWLVTKEKGAEMRRDG